MYTPRTSVEAIPNASIHHSALQNRDFGHTYDRSRALVKALENRMARLSRLFLGPGDNFWKSYDENRFAQNRPTW